MLKNYTPKIRYSYPDKNIFLMISYCKYPKKGYVIYVYSLHKDSGKGISFCSLDDLKLKKLFIKLEKKDIKTRLKILYKLIKKLKNQIEERDIPFYGIRKIKRYPVFSINLKH